LAASVAACGAITLALHWHHARDIATRDIITRDDFAAGTVSRPSPVPPAESSAEREPVPSEPRQEPHRHSPPRAKTPPEPTLADETDALDRARTALGDEQPLRALATLDDYDHVLRGHRLSEEATLLRIEALEKAGMVDAARTLAGRFAAKNPNSPLVDRALSLVGGALDQDSPTLPKENAP
jgi:hypothetical protein